LLIDTSNIPGLIDPGGLQIRLSGGLNATKSNLPDFSPKNLGIGVLAMHLAGFSEFVILAVACQSIFSEILS